MEARTLELSDLATEQEAEIIENPYQFLKLQRDSPAEHVRKSYIRLARGYHPDLVNPKFDVQELPKLYSNKDAEAANLGHSIDEVIEIWRNPETKPEERGKILEGISLMSHRKMVLFNRAYQEIKARYNPAEWNKLFGYDFETVFNREEGHYNKVVSLEGRGEVTVFPNHYEYWVAGPYLHFDYGPDDNHPWVDWGYRHEINLRHLFAHIEVLEGKRISGILLKPFFDCFGLDKQKSNTLIGMLSTGEGVEAVMKRLGVPNDSSIDYKEDSDKWLYSLRFRRQLNEITTLLREPAIFYPRDLIPSWEVPPIKVQVKDGKLTLEDYTQTNFSEADYILFLTLAYGPLLKS